jgi:iron complex outermembrane receptor protein
MQRIAGPMKQAVCAGASFDRRLESQASEDSPMIAGNSRFTTLVLLFAAANAEAQDSAVKSAADAFGERVGTEQSGLYTETQVRGFDLNESGAYRIDDAYFSRAAALNDPVLAGVGVRVGVNAVRLAYPAPSGVVNYRLRQAGPANELRLGVGLRDFGTQVVQGDASVRDGDCSFAGGFVWRPAWRLAQGYEGRAFDVGGVGAWQIGPDQRARVFATVYQRSYDGDYAVLPRESAAPPNLETLHQYSPSWAATEAVSSNVGVLYDGKIGGFTLDAAAFHSLFDMKRTDYTLMSIDADGLASATDYRNPARAKRADSAEVRLGRQFESGVIDHLATVSLRGGRTVVDLTSNLAIPLGDFDLHDGDAPDGVERPWSGTRGTDTAEQVTVSAGYGLAWRDRLQLRFALHRTRYDKDVLSIAGVRTDGVSEATLYNSSAVFGITDRTTLFGSWVTGLEEAGVAPTSAINRDEVLPPVEARQFELGVRHALTTELNFIAALFDVSRPTSGFRADRSFGAVGEVRHRGIEGSIAGMLGATTRVVVGAVAFRSDVTGPLVNAGTVGAHAAGVSQRLINASVERQLAKGWSADAVVSYSGERWADTANTFRMPAVTLVSLGARRKFMLANRPAEFRLLASNLTGVEGYWAAPSGVFSPIPPRTVRALLTLTFGPGDRRAE